MKRIFLLVAAVILLCPLSYGRQPQRGYRGFLEWSSSVRSYSFYEWSPFPYFYSWRETTFYTGLSTSHGYQINSMFFVGAGMGIERCYALYAWIAPVFLQGRADFKFGIFTPFADLRAGVNLPEGVGMYLSPTVGYRFNWGRKVGINIALGLTLAGYKTEYFDGYWIGPDDYEIRYVDTRHKVRAYFSFRVGFDF